MPPSSLERLVPVVQGAIAPTILISGVVVAGIAWFLKDLALSLVALDLELGFRP